MEFGSLLLLATWYFSLVTSLRFASQPNHSYVLPGNLLHLTCRAIPLDAGNPSTRAVYQWLVDGSPHIPTPGRYSLPNGTMIIEKFRVEHAGSYACVASANGSIIESESAQVKAASPPVLSMAPHRAEVFTGESVLFDCLAKGEPPPSISWDISALSMQEDLSSLYLRPNNHTIFIPDTSTLHSGCVYCHARNIAGSESRLAYLVIVDQSGRRIYRRTSLYGMIQSKHLDYVVVCVIGLACATVTMVAAVVLRIRALSRFEQCQRDIGNMESKL